MSPCPPSRWHRLLWRFDPRHVVLGVSMAVGFTVVVLVHDVAEMEDEDCPPVVAEQGVDSSVGDDEREPDGEAYSKTVPPTPLVGQRKVDKEGKCPSAWHIPINGGCWRKLADTPTPDESCGEDAYEHRGACYVWVRDSKRANTTITE